MIKSFKIELIALVILILNIFVSYNIDIGFYNLFNNYNNSLQNIYLKDFFKQITALGDSKWYFSLSLLAVLVGIFLRGNKYLNKHKKILDIKISFGIFLFSSVLVTGLITQLLKHVVGRPRPNYTSLDQNIGFDFFNLSSEFHSFPSGHTSTIFVVALTIAYFMPKLKFFLLFVAAIIAFSRVVVGAHFFTDIIGGIVVAYIGIKITELILSKLNLINKKKAKEGLDLFFKYIFINTKFYYVAVVFSCLVLFLSIGPSIDIYLSGLFYFGENKFLLQSYYDITIFFRKIVLRAIIIYILILPIVSLWLPIKGLYFDYRFNLKDIVFIWASNFFNLLIIVNLLLKNLWGRARPGDIIQLGGKESFTPWYQLSDACNTNCSFVSGDAAIGFSIIALYFVTKKEIYFWLSIVFGSLLGLVRIMEGGHFVSDVTMSAFIIFLAYVFQMKYFYNRYDKI